MAQGHGSRPHWQLLLGREGRGERGKGRWIVFFTQEVFNKVSHTAGFGSSVSGLLDIVRCVLKVSEAGDTSSPMRKQA